MIAMHWRKGSSDADFESNKFYIEQNSIYIWMQCEENGYFFPAMISKQ